MGGCCSRRASTVAPPAPCYATIREQKAHNRTTYVIDVPGTTTTRLLHVAVTTTLTDDTQIEHNLGGYTPLSLGEFALLVGSRDPPDGGIDSIRVSIVQISGEGINPSNWVLVAPRS